MQSVSSKQPKRTLNLSSVGKRTKFDSTWKTARLDSVASVGSGVTLGKDLSGHPTVELPYLRVENVQAGFLDLSEIKTVRVRPDEVANYLLESGDVLMTEGGDIDKLGRGAIWKGAIQPCLHQNHIFRVRPNPEVLDPRFLESIICCDIGRRYFFRIAKRTTNLASINKTQLRAFELPLPPIDEQRAIAAILDAADVSIDRIREMFHQARELRRALVTTEIDKLGGIPVRLEGFIAEITYGTSQASNDRAIGYPTLRIPNVVGDGLDLTDLSHVEAPQKHVARYGLTSGDLLLVRTNGNPTYIGRSVVFRPPSDATWFYASYLIRVRLKDGLVPEYVDEYLRTERGRKELFRRVTTSAGNYNINSRNVSSLLVPVPSETEQWRIVQLAGAANGLVATLKRRVSAAEKLKRGLMQDLLVEKDHGRAMMEVGRK